MNNDIYELFEQYKLYPTYHKNKNEHSETKRFVQVFLLSKIYSFMTSDSKPLQLKSSYTTGNPLLVV